VQMFKNTQNTEWSDTLPYCKTFLPERCPSSLKAAYCVAYRRTALQTACNSDVSYYSLY